MKKSSSFLHLFFISELLKLNMIYAEYRKTSYSIQGNFCIKLSQREGFAVNNSEIPHVKDAWRGVRGFSSKSAWVDTSEQIDHNTIVKRRDFQCHWKKNSKLPEIAFFEREAICRYSPLSYLPWRSVISPIRGAVIDWTSCGKSSVYSYHFSGLQFVPWR